MTAPRIGLLSFAHPHAHAYARALGTALVGVADDDHARGTNAAAQYGVPFWDGDLPALDGAIVCAENARHLLWTRRALDAGARFVLCEKPLAASLADAQAMITACADAGAALFTAFSCRYAPPFVRAWDWVQAGKIGSVLAINAVNRGKMPGGWFTDTALSGGGAIIDHTVHVADLNHLLLNKDAVSVYAERGSGFFGSDYDDTGLLTVTYDGGVFASLDTSWSRPSAFPVWGDVRLEIVGTAGVLSVDLFAQHAHVFNQDGAQQPFWGSDMDALMVEDFLTACAGAGVPRLATGADGLRALRIALAAYESARQGQPVFV